MCLTLCKYAAAGARREEESFADGSWASTYPYVCSSCSTCTWPCTWPSAVAVCCHKDWEVMCQQHVLWLWFYLSLRMQHSIARAFTYCRRSKAKARTRIQGVWVCHVIIISKARFMNRSSSRRIKMQMIHQLSFISSEQSSLRCHFFLSSNCWRWRWQTETAFTTSFVSFNAVSTELNIARRLSKMMTWKHSRSRLVRVRDFAQLTSTHLLKQL